MASTSLNSATNKRATSARSVGGVGGVCGLYTMTTQNKVSFLSMIRRAYAVRDLQRIENCGVDTLAFWLCGFINDKALSARLEKGGNVKLGAVKGAKVRDGFLVYSKVVSRDGKLSLQVEAVRHDGTVYSRAANAADVRDCGAQAVIVTDTLANVRAGVAKGGIAQLCDTREQALAVAKGLAVSRKVWRDCGFEFAAEKSDAAKK